jgi:membrane-associated protein
MFDVERWLEAGGILLLAAIVFAESGLAVGFFLPGDSLLFIAGFLTSDAGGNVLPPLPVTAGVVFIAAVIGDQVGYWFGAKAGPVLFERRSSRWFHPEHVRRAHDFMERHGPATVVLARFVPIVRTFVPIVAGIGRMHYPTFFSFNVLGALLWGVGITALGHFLGAIPVVERNLELAILAVIAISLTPMAVNVFRKWRRTRRTADQTSTDA